MTNAPESPPEKPALTAEAAEAHRDDVIRTIVIVVLTIVVIATSLAAFRKVTKGKSAFVRWQPQIVELFKGEDIYEKYEYPNPPIVAMTLAPIALLPTKLGAALLILAKVAMAGLAIAWSLRLAGGASRWKWAWIAVVLALSLRVLMSDVQHGNINIIILFVVIAALEAFTRGRDLTAGLMLALAIAFKVTPGLFIPYFLYKRQWKLLLATFGGLFLFLIVIPSVALGPVRNWEMLNSWADAVVLPYMQTGTTRYTFEINQSIPGLYYRLVTKSWGIHWDDETKTRVHLMRADPEVAKWVLKGILLSLVGLLAWLCRTPMTDRRNWRLACEYGLVLIAMLWISERSWKHHHVTMVLPYACVMAAIGLRRVFPVRRRVLIGLLIASITLGMLTTESVTGWIHIDSEGHYEGHKWFLAYGAFFLSIAAIFVGLAMLVRAREPDTSEPDTSEPDTSEPDMIETRTASPEPQD